MLDGLFYLDLEVVPKLILNHDTDFNSTYSSFLCPSIFSECRTVGLGSVQTCVVNKCNFIAIKKLFVNLVISYLHKGFKGRTEAELNITNN
jgi:hypothetical protein